MKVRTEQGDIAKNEPEFYAIRMSKEEVEDVLRCISFYEKSSDIILSHPSITGASGEIVKDDVKSRAKRLNGIFKKII